MTEIIYGKNFLSGWFFMIQAVLGGKSLGYEYAEDILTSVVFGTLKWTQPSVLLIPFIESAFLYNEHRTTLLECLKLESVDLRCYRTVDYIFWPYHSTHGEPDLILMFKNHVHGDEDLLFIIEAKFKSSKSSVGERDQLVRYFRAIEDSNIEGFSEPTLSSFKGKKGYIIYLTESLAHSEIIESDLIIDKDSSDNKQIFHLRWHQLYKTYERMYPYLLTKFEENIVDDLMEFMEAVGLRDYSGVSLPSKSLTIEVSQPYPIFYGVKNYSNHISTYFDLTVNYDFKFKKNIFFRG